MIKLGQKVKFDPWRGINSIGGATGEEVEGTVIYIHPAHRYFTTEYKLGDEKFKTSFNFVDLYGEPKSVRIVRG